jgi:hypothetical protein
MAENFKLDRSFGPVGSFSGMILFVLGLISTSFNIQPPVVHQPSLWALKKGNPFGLPFSL